MGSRLHRLQRGWTHQRLLVVVRRREAGIQDRIDHRSYVSRGRREFRRLGSTLMMISILRHYIWVEGGCPTFELLGRARVIFVLVWMPFQRRFAIGFLDFILSGG